MGGTLFRAGSSGGRAVDRAGHEVTTVVEAFVSPVGNLDAGGVGEAAKVGAGRVGGGVGLGEA